MKISSEDLIEIVDLIKDGMRYRALKEKISYEMGHDNMQWATMNWVVDVYSLAPDTLDGAIDEYLLKE